MNRYQTILDHRKTAYRTKLDNKGTKNHQTVSRAHVVKNAATSDYAANMLSKVKVWGAA
jgi:hypothetical protein